jgi:hypothetical protein
MKKSALKYILTAVFVLVMAVAFADAFDDVVTAMKVQSAKDISKFMNTSVELTINDNEGVYSKQQAEIMLRNFFAQNQPKTITIQHKGSSGQGAKYAIAIYESAQGKFRVYIFMKDNGSGTALIHEMRIEKE